MKMAGFLITCAALLSSCAGAPPRTDGRVTVRAVGLPADGSVTRVVVSVSGTGATTDLAYDGVNAWVGAVIAPAGAREVSIQAFRGGDLIGQGSAAVEVTAGGVATAMIWVLDVSGTPPTGNHGPIIVSVSATPAELAPGAATTLAVRAIDPDGDPLSYQWSQGCSPGAFSAPLAAATQWTTTAELVCPLTVSVSDGTFTASASLDVRVNSGSGTSGQVDVQAGFVAQPYVDRVALTYTGGPGWSTWLGMLTIGRSPGTEGYETLDTSIPEIVYPGQPLPFQVIYANMPIAAGWESELETWIDDDCGGAAVQSVYTFDGVAYEIINGREANFTWRSGPVAGLCLVSFHVSYRGLSDAFTLALVTDGCADDTDHFDSTPALATSFYAPWPTDGRPLPPPAEPVVRTLSDRWANDVDWYAFKAQAWATSVTVEAVSADRIPLELYAADATTLLAAGDNAVTLPVTAGARYYVKVGPGAAAAACGSGYDYRITAAP